MILSAPEIRRRLDAGTGLVIRPYHEPSQQPASYDLRVTGHQILARGACTLVPSLEWVELPADLAATLRCRSSYARRGLIIGGGFVDPGFRGQLTLCLSNLGGEDIVISPSDRVVQMIIHEVAGGTELYDGRYQDSDGVVRAR
ncbi:MAG TPA: dCTP deaminase [Methanomicrobiales archaeon]|nr:dCTP deaminase [Methanomicrobiales archaeon]